MFAPSSTSSLSQASLKCFKNTIMDMGSNGLKAWDFACAAVRCLFWPDNLRPISHTNSKYPLGKKGDIRMPSGVSSSQSEPLPTFFAAAGLTTAFTGVSASRARESVCGR